MDGLKKNRIADRVKIANINFEKRTKNHLLKAVVGYSDACKVLNFNRKMIALLSLKNWKYVIVGYDQKAKVLVLKETDVEDFGAVAVRLKPEVGRTVVDPGEKATMQIFIGHVVKALDIRKGSHFRAEREGVMIFLELIEE